jgi:hypothetical protein
VIVTLILDMRLILQGERGGDRRLIVKRGGA